MLLHLIMFVPMACQAMASIFCIFLKYHILDFVFTHKIYLKAKQSFANKS